MLEMMKNGLGWLGEKFKRKPKVDDADRLGEALEKLSFGGNANMHAGVTMLLVDIQRGRALDRQRESAEFRWKMMRRYFFLFAMAVGVISSSTLYLYRNGYQFPKDKPVAVVAIAGEIGSGKGGAADFIIPSLRNAFADQRSQVVILRINSGGGLPVDAERVTTELAALRVKHPKKKVVAVIESVGASAAYMIAVHADEIYAGRYSLVGSVGAIMQTWNFAELAKRVGVTQDSYTSGSLKEMLSPFKQPSDVQKKKVLSLASGLGEDFAEEVLKARGERLKMSKQGVATGEIWTGTQALELGLIDKIGTLETVTAEFDGQPREYGPFTERSTLEKIAKALSESFVEASARILSSSQTPLPR
jgi:protease-4